MKQLATLALVVPLLAGCVSPRPLSPYPKSDGAERRVCSNAALEQFVGRPATAELGTQIIRTSGAKTLQWVPAGSMVTMDFREDRVRVSLDEKNRVQRVSCG